MTVYTIGGTVDPIKHDNDVPIHIGWQYNITPGEASSQWVEITDIYRGYVYTTGVGRTTAEWAVPTWKFDDLIKDWRERGYFLITEDSLNYITTEDGDKLLGQ